MMTQQEFLIIFFSNIVSDLKIIDYNNCHPLAENIQEPVLKAIIKHRNHPRILTIGKVRKKNQQFSFRSVDKEEILKEILNLDKFRCIKRKMLIFTKIFFIPILTFPVPIPDGKRKEAFKAFIKPFEAPQRSVRIKI